MFCDVATGCDSRTETSEYKYSAIPAATKKPASPTNTMNASGRAHNRHMASMSSPAVTKIPEKRNRRSILLRVNSLAFP